MLETGFRTTALWLDDQTNVNVKMLMCLNNRTEKKRKAQGSTLKLLEHLTFVKNKGSDCISEHHVLNDYDSAIKISKIFS